MGVTKNPPNEPNETHVHCIAKSLGLTKTTIELTFLVLIRDGRRVRYAGTWTQDLGVTKKPPMKPTFIVLLSDWSKKHVRSVGTNGHKSFRS